MKIRLRRTLSGGTTPRALAELPADPAVRLKLLQGLLDEWHDGRWILEEEIGAGAAGVVWKASDSRLTAVAIKFTLIGPDGDKKAEREAAVLQRVAHPHVCRVHEYSDKRTGFAAAGVFALVLELLGGGSLSQLLDEHGGKLEQREVASLTYEILMALE